MSEIMVFLEPYPQLKPYIAMGLALTVLLGPFYFIQGIVKPPLIKLWNSLVNQFYREISIHISDSDYSKFNLWMDNNSQYTSFRRSYKVVSSDGTSGDSIGSDTESPSRLVAGYGSVLINAPSMPFVWVSRSKEEGKQVYQQTENLKLRVFSIRAKRLYDLFNEIIKTKEPEGPFVFNCNDGYFLNIGRPKNTLEPIENGAREFVSNIGDFLKSEDSYKSRGVPYKRGYLLYGPPGTGKSSVVAYAANHFNMNIYLIDSRGIVSFSGIAKDVTKRSIILIEDIDMTIAGNGRKGTIGQVDSGEEKDKNEKSASEMAVSESMRGFLNSLDGITQFEDSIIVVTTNKPNVLDPALLRHGRIDCQIEIGQMSPENQFDHFNRFYPSSNKDSCEEITTDRPFSELQFICNSNMHDAESAWAELCTPSTRGRVEQLRGAA